MTQITLHIAEHQIDQLKHADARVASMVEKEIANQAVDAAHNAWNQAQCTCGHTRHWHHQTPPQPRGSGGCDDCACTKFQRAV